VTVISQLVQANLSSAERTHPEADRRAWYTLVLLSVVMGMSYADRMVLPVLVTPIKAELNLSDTQIGLLTGFAFSIFYAVCSLPIGRLADRGSRKLLVSLTLTCWSIATALTATVTGVGQMLLARCAVGAGEGGAVPSAYSMIGDLFPPQRRTTALAIFTAGGPVGVLVSLMLAGWLGELVGWRATFVVIGLPGLLLALIFWITVREPARPVASEGGQGDSATWGVVAALCRNPAFIHYTLGYSVAVLLLHGHLQWLPAFFHRSFGVGGASLGFSIAMTRALGTILGLVAGGLLADWLAKRDPSAPNRIIFAASALGVLTQAGVLLTANLYVAYTFSAVVGFVTSLPIGPLTAAIQAQAPPRARATAGGIMLILSSVIGMGGGPLAVGVLSDLLAARAGQESLRYSLMILTVIAGPWMLMHLACAQRLANGGNRLK
jgi:MFS transporter, Spinster family, sphingosine-1-phosphate transporter